MYDNAIETIETNDLIFRIIPDSDCESPREWGNLGTMVCFHNRYRFGDKDHGLKSSDFDSWDELEQFLIEERDAAVVLPIYMYDHGGVTIATSPFSCSWDSGRIGYIYVSKEKVRKEYGVKRITKSVLERVTSCLQGEIETYDQYLVGDVYGFTITKVSKCDHNHDHEEVIDSCWGFYGHNPIENGMLDNISEEELCNIIRTKYRKAA